MTSTTPPAFRCLLFLLAAMLLPATASFGQENTPADLAPAGKTTESGESGTETAASADEAAAMKGASLFERLGQGGVTMVFLALVSVAALTFAIERVINLKKGAINPEGFSVISIDREGAFYVDGAPVSISILQNHVRTLGTQEDAKVRIDIDRDTPFQRAMELFNIFAFENVAHTGIKVRDDRATGQY